MAPSFFRKLVSRKKSKRTMLDLRSVWTRPSIEALDERILPSVNATLSNGILSIIADTNGGTTQVEIVHDQDQVKVEDSQQLVNNFGIDQIQQINFQYNQYSLSLPVGQNQITLTNLPVGEADLNLGDSSLTASINAKLPDGTDLALSGTVNSDGSYDVTGRADVTVGGFAIQGAAFEVTNTSVAVSAAVTVGGDSVSLAGTLGDQGYDLTGTADVTVDGFALQGASFHLTNDSLAAAATLAIGSDDVSLAGSVGSDGSYDLTGTADVTVDGFALQGASFELTNTSLAAAATVAVGGDSVSLSGTVDNQGNYDLTGTADVTVDGFTLSGASFELTNSSLTAAATVAVGGDSVSLSGSVDSQGNYDLTGTADVTVDGFALQGASFELTNTSLTAAATLAIGGDSVSLSGSVDRDGNYDLMGTADITVDGFALSGASFELTNTSLSASATLTVGSDTVSLSGTVDNDGNYDLMGTADITVAGFAISGASFELTNTSLSATATLSFAGDSLTLSGSVTSDGTYDLTGTADITIAGFTLPGTSFELTNGTGLTNGGLTVSATLPLGDNSVSLTGSVDPDGNYDLMGTADITVGGFALPGASFELTNTSLTVSVTLTLGGDSVSLSGSLDNQGNYDLTGTADITVGGFALPGASFELTNTSLTVSATLNIGSDSVSLSGTVDNQGNYDLTGTADVTVATIPLSANFELTNDSLTVSATVSILGNDINLAGTVDAQGNYDLTATGTIAVAGFNVDANFELTNDSLTVSTTLSLGSVGSVSLSGTYADGQLGDLTGTGTITVGGLNLNVNATYHDSTLSFTSTVSLNGLGSVSLSGTYAQGQPLSLTGTGTITVAGFSLNATVTVNTGITVSTTLAVGSAGSVTLSGTYANGQLGDLSGTGTLTVAGLNLNVNASYHNSVLTFMAVVALGSLGNINLSGTYASGQPLSLTGTGTITVAGFSLNATVTVNTAITVSTTLAVGSLGSVSLSGTYASGQLGDLSGTGTLTIAGLNLMVHGTYHANTLTFTATVALGSLGNINLSGTYASGQPLSLTGTGTITVAGFSLNATVSVGTAITVSTTLAVGSLGSISLSGTFNNGQLGDLSGTGTLTVAGLNLMVHGTYHANTLTFTATVALGSLGNISLSGTYAQGQPLSLTGTGTITVAGFSLTATVTVATAITVSTSLAVGTLGSVSLSGTFSNGQLGDLSGTGTLTVGGFNLNVTGTYHASTLTITGSVALGSLGNVSLSGTYSRTQPLSLTGTGTITVAGFSLSATVTLGTSLTVSATLNVGSTGSIGLSGTFTNGQLGDLTGTGTLTIAGFSLTVRGTYHNSTLTFTTTVNVGGTNVNLSGTYSNSQGLSLTGSASFSIAGFNVTPSFTLTTSALTVAVGVNIPSVGTLNFAGTVDSHGSFSLSATAHVVIAGFGLDATFRLTNTSLTVSATVNLPIVGSVNLSGTMDSQGHYSLTAGVSDIHILFVTLTSASVTLTNNSLTVAAHASNLPLIGNVNFTGTISGNSYTFTATIPSVTILGFTLKNVSATLTNNSLAVGTHVDGIPLIGSADFTGTISSGSFSLAATAHNIDLLGFIHFNTIALTLNQSSLSLSATVNLPLVNTVTFAGAINFNGSFTISATAPHFTVLGFIGIDNATVAISFPNPKLTVSAHINLLNIGMVDFTGSIGAGGTFSFDGSASLNVAGFSLGTARMHMGNMPGDPSDGIHIGPFTTPPLPLVGAVTVEGSYASGGRFSFLATIHPTPPIQIGPIPVDTIIFGLSNDSLTLGIGVGYSLSSFLHIGGQGVVTVYAPSAQHNFGDFDLVASVDVTIVGFSAANGRMELRNTRGQFSFTVDANINLIIATANFHGEIDFNKGLVGFAGAANIGVAGFTLSNSNFLITNAQVQFVSGQWSFQHDAQGHLISGNGIHIEVHSHTALHLPPVIDANVDFDGTFQKSGTSGYQIAVHGVANLTVVGFNLASASLDIDNSHMAVAVHYAYPGNLFVVDFRGSLDYHGNFDVQADGSIGLAGFRVAQVHFHLNNRLLQISGSANVLVATIGFNGEFHSNGTFDFEADVGINFAGFSVARGHVKLYNDGRVAGVQVTADVNVFVATLHVNGSVDTRGYFDFSADIGLNFAGFSVARGHVRLYHDASGSGVTVNASVNVYVATLSVNGSVDNRGYFDFSADIGLNFAGFHVARGHVRLYRNASGSGVSVDAMVNVYVATIHVTGAVNSNGTFRFVVGIGMGFAGFGGNGTVTLTNTGVSVDAQVNVIVASIHVVGSVSSSGAFRFQVNTRLGFHGFGANGTVVLSNGGVSVTASLDVSILGIHMSVNGAVNSNGTFSFSFHAGLGWSVIGASVDFRLSNNGFSATLHAGFDLSAGVSWWIFSLRVGVRGSVDVGFNINTNGTFSADGGLQACAYLGIGGCFGIGFHLDNHQFCIRTHQIGFSIWGVGFHPFGDLCVGF